MQYAPVSQLLNVYACRPVGEISLTVEDGGSVRVEMWDTAGQEQVSFILSFYLAIPSYMHGALLVYISVYTCSFVR